MNAALHRPRARGSLVLAANLSAVATWVVGLLYWQVLVVAEETSGDMFGGLVAALLLMAFQPILVAALVVAAAAVFAVPLGIAWALSDDQPLLPGLSFAHALLAWVLVPTMLFLHW